LYWENSVGLKTVAEIFGAHNEVEAAARIKAARITHVAMVSSYDFLPEYSYALKGIRVPVTELRKQFGHQFFYEHRVPVWLRPLDYHVPTPLAPLGVKVALFTVDFAALPEIAHERIGLYQLANGATDLAEASFMASLAANANRAEPWLRLGELGLSRGRLAEAFNFIQAGILRAPQNQRAPLIRAAAQLFARQGSSGNPQVEALRAMLVESAPTRP
jgi:tetratricopeptide (TPR) repeat protein